MEKLQSERNEWIKLRSIIKQESIDMYNPDNENWDAIITLLNDGFTKKYFKPLELLLSDGANDGEGYLIVSIQCILIEAFSTLKLGLNYADVENDKLNDFHYNNPSEIFKNFLKEESPFKITFETLQNQLSYRGYDSLVIDFYKNVRCGLIHSARFKNNWIVSSENDTDKTNNIFIEIVGKNKVILRNILNRLLVDYFDSIIKDLKNEDKVFDYLRMAICRKMDNLYGFEMDNIADWWNEL